MNFIKADCGPFTVNAFSRMRLIQRHKSDRFCTVPIFDPFGSLGACQGEERESS